jgi:hypothetical protein
MRSSGTPPTVLFVVADCPGHFAELAYRTAEKLRNEGVESAFALTTPFYERFAGISMSDIGPTHYLSEFLQSCPDGPELQEVQLDYWLTHPTFVRTRYYRRRHLNPWDDYKKIALFFRQLIAQVPNLAAVWSEPPSSATIGMAYQEATRLGVPFLGYQAARIPQHFVVALDRYGTKLLENPVAPSYMPSPDDLPDYMDKATSVAHRSLLRELQSAPTKLARSIASRTGSSIEIGNPTGHQIRALSRQLGRKLYHSLFVRERFFDPLPEPDNGKVKILFPLQYRPEASTSMQARFYENDLETIRNIAFSLPYDAHLYVKEHPAAVGSHSRSFFRDVLSFPNTHLLGIQPALGQCLPRFDAMVCLTSTAGFEAIQEGVPVLLLGRVFYEDYPGVTRVESWDALAGELAKIKRRVHNSHRKEPMDRYLRTCFEGGFNYLDPRVLDPGNIEKLLEPIRIILNRA